eukprot:TRINITY_DN3248_c0_g1_i3.p1 TRINITY_DN3248_c0_g1~~TRINITY_DN3248_c0_g1_i3.p1  ORF type:complete len:357 (+),score=114.38 TRINITY_DN3248_c0_g1_i3:126-1073(+)
MVWPPSWQDAGGRIGVSPGQSCSAGSEYYFDEDLEKTGATCLWYTNYTMKEGKSTIEPSMRTFANIEAGYESYVENNPWMAPGSAKLFSGCGVAGGNPVGCPEGSPSRPGQDCSPYGGGYSYGPRAEDFEFMDVVTTEWKKGEVVKAGWGMVANHGGGYSYRLCKVPEGGVQGLTEECFQQMPLKFASDKQWIQVGDDETTRREFLANRTIVGTIPSGSEWTKNPVPNCSGMRGGFFDDGPTCPAGYQFPPPIEGLFGQGANIHYDPKFTFQWTLMDELQVPENLETGDYVLSFRWDCEQTPQVWNTCSSIKIVE